MLCLLRAPVLLVGMSRPHFLQSIAFFSAGHEGEMLQMHMQQCQLHDPMLLKVHTALALAHSDHKMQ